MSAKLDPKEVLQYLNELGYSNITAQQLKEFMRDLKKLIKYDIKKANKENVENIPSHGRYYRTPCTQVEYDSEKFYTSQIQIPEKRYGTTATGTEYKFAETPYVQKPVESIFSNLHSASTVSSRARSAVQITSVPGVSFAPRKKSVTSHGDQSEESRLTSFVTEYTGEGSATRSVLSQQCRPKSTGPALHRPKSFIRPTIPLHSSKSDPVTLYHRYQAEWKKQKRPGEDSHKDLRWAIREKMLSAPSIQPATTRSMTTIKSNKRL